VVNFAGSCDAADKIVDQITNAGGNAVAIQGDVARAPDVERLKQHSISARLTPW
jgi:3-oxoacyl-[acyl-carrier protein] reductase